MSPRKAAAPKPPKPWRRDDAGTYRDAEGRFELSGDGAGRWFVRDEAETDELGLPRTTGPFATLAEAKAAADHQREAGAPASPLAAMLDAARSRPERQAAGPTSAASKALTKRASGERSPAPATATRGTASGQAPRADASPADREAAPADHQAERARPSPGKAPAAGPKPSAAARKPTWLDELQARDPAAARQARALIAELERRGIDDADALVRRDRLGGRPAVGERLLLLAVRSRVAAALVDAPGSPAERAAIASRVIAAVLGAVSDGGSGGSLPTWELVEGKTGRRLRPDAADQR